MLEAEANLDYVGSFLFDLLAVFVLQHSSKTSNKKRAWRSLKQIVAQERALQWGEDFVHCK
jgi:hypothetical protein